MTWTWRYEAPDGTAVDKPESPKDETFPTQSDAESWIGENWRELMDGGVARVTLFDGDREVYGPMDLSPAAPAT